MHARLIDGSCPVPIAGFPAAQVGPRPTIKRISVPLFLFSAGPVRYALQGATLLTRANKAPNNTLGHPLGPREAADA